LSKAESCTRVEKDCCFEPITFLKAMTRSGALPQVVGSGLTTAMNLEMSTTRFRPREILMRFSELSRKGFVKAFSTGRSIRF
jgi:hypothetical protein